MGYHPAGVETPLSFGRMIIEDDYQRVAQRELTAADWHRLNRLLAEALDLEGEARTAWLAALAG